MKFVMQLIFFTLCANLVQGQKRESYAIDQALKNYQGRVFVCHSLPTKNGHPHVLKADLAPNLTVADVAETVLLLGYEANIRDGSMILLPSDLDQQILNSHVKKNSGLMNQFLVTKDFKGTFEAFADLIFGPKNWRRRRMKDEELIPDVLVREFKFPKGEYVRIDALLFAMKQLRIKRLDLFPTVMIDESETAFRKDNGELINIVTPIIKLDDVCFFISITPET